jgi:hypothetical protein
MIKLISRGVLDTPPSRGTTISCSVAITVIASAANQTILSSCSAMDCVAALAMTWMGHGGIPQTRDFALIWPGAKSSVPDLELGFANSLTPM